MVLDRQTMLDMAVQVSGSVEAAFDLAVRNGLSITERLLPGMELLESEPVNRDIAIYYAAKRLQPATETDWEPDTKPSGEGIEFWAIEIDFVVS